MKVSRRLTTRINWVLDEWVPPRIRDSRMLASLALKLQGEGTIPIDEFKDRAFGLSEREFGDFYEHQSYVLDQGATDLIAESAERVCAEVVGDRVLDVACGRGYLSDRLAGDHRVVACDVAPPPHSPRYSSVQGLIERLPFADGAFDTVVSTHTLEHTQHLPLAIAELRRVSARRLVIVVPRQRPYNVTFNAHLHFFPYGWSLLAWTGAERPYSLDLVAGDWLYVESR